MNPIRFLGKFIDYPTAIAGAIIMGVIVGLVNADHGIWPAVTAASKQAAYTFLFGGLMIKLLYKIVASIKPKLPSVILATLSISLLTITLVYLVHSMKGTPKPFFSTLPTIVFAPGGFFALAWRRRKKLEARASQQSTVGSQQS
jgi:hypothetical protein